MSNVRNLFVLAGNGSYENRGCEAIVRGTAEILSRYFENLEFLVYSNFVNRKQYLSQIRSERDKRITHKGLVYAKNYSLRWVYENVIERLSPQLFREYLYKDMLRYLPDAKAVLSVGGDNYSLDYGKPKFFLDLNELVISRKKPLILWGASVGPFSDNPEYEKFILEQLKRVVIFARERDSAEYLASKGLKDNVFRVADPAFMLNPEMPPTEKLPFDIEEGAVGINLSPLMAKYVTGGDMKSWVKRSAEIIEGINANFKRPIYLIPHVTMPGNDDSAFMREALSLVNMKAGKIVLIPPILNAAESKWVISKMLVFMGARTHATIAAFSSGVPTLSLGYSTKASGINKEIFGHSEFCIFRDQIKLEFIISKMRGLIDRRDLIHERLVNYLPIARQMNRKSCELLMELCK